MKRHGLIIISFMIMLGVPTLSDAAAPVEDGKYHIPAGAKQSEPKVVKKPKVVPSPVNAPIVAPKLAHENFKLESATKSAKPVSAKYHIVKKGEILSQIAKRHGTSVQALRQANNLSSANSIMVGQRLVLQKPKAVAKALIDKLDQLANWRWPTKGEIGEEFGDSNKGIDITGTQGQAVKAVQPGVVMYSGAGLPGYGELVIIKHKNYLSAYGNNQNLLVVEGSRVVAGQQIAEMGVDTKGDAKLHFEVRADGKPLDPMLFLSE